MTTKTPDKKGKKLTVKKATIKDLKVGTEKEGDVKGGGGRYQATKSPSTGPGCC